MNKGIYKKLTTIEKRQFEKITGIVVYPDTILFGIILFQNERNVRVCDRNGMIVCSVSYKTENK